MKSTRLTSEHQYECYSPCDLGVGFVELFRQFADGERDGEEVEGIPALQNWSVFQSGDTQGGLRAS